jgi:hypothetical protein
MQVATIQGDVVPAVRPIMIQGVDVQPEMSDVHPEIGARPA